MISYNPPIRPGAAPGAAVQLVYPRCKARLVPASSETGSTSNTVTTGVQVGWLQQLGGP